MGGWGLGAVSGVVGWTVWCGVGGALEDVDAVGRARLPVLSSKSLVRLFVPLAVLGWEVLRLLRLSLPAPMSSSSS